MDVKELDNFHKILLKLYFLCPHLLFMVLHFAQFPLCYSSYSSPVCMQHLFDVTIAIENNCSRLGQFNLGPLVLETNNTMLQNSSPTYTEHIVFSKGKENYWSEKHFIFHKKAIQYNVLLL